MATKRFEAVVQLDNGLLVPAGAAEGRVLTSDGSGNATWKAPATKLFRFSNTFAILGKVTVLTIPGFFVDVSSGQVLNLVKARYKITAGTNVKFKLQKNGSDLTGYTAIEATTTAATTSSNKELKADDAVTLVIESVSGTPENLSVSCIMEAEH